LAKEEKRIVGRPARGSVDKEILGGGAATLTVQ
jgi:hypothetical protein